MKTFVLLLAFCVSAHAAEFGAYYTRVELETDATTPVDISIEGAKPINP
ncbi:MAG: hypothetical protein ACKOLA_07360 [Spartobacteria bacterium]